MTCHRVFCTKPYYITNEIFTEVVASVASMVTTPLFTLND